MQLLAVLADAQPLVPDHVDRAGKDDAAGRDVVPRDDVLAEVAHIALERDALVDLDLAGARDAAEVGAAAGGELFVRSLLLLARRQRDKEQT